MVYYVSVSGYCEFSPPRVQVTICFMFLWTHTSSLSWVWVLIWRPKRILNPGLGRRRSGRQSWHPTSNRRTGRDRRPSFPTNALPWIPSWMVEYAQSPTSSCRGHRWWQWVQSRKGSGRWLGRHRHKGCWPRSSALRRIRRCPKIAASSPTTFLVQKKTIENVFQEAERGEQMGSTFKVLHSTSNLGTGFTPAMEADHRNIQRQIMNSTHPKAK